MYITMVINKATDGLMKRVSERLTSLSGKTEPYPKLSSSVAVNLRGARSVASNVLFADFGGGTASEADAAVPVC